MQIDERIQAYLDKVGPCVEGNGGDTKLYRVACALWNGFELNGEETLEWLRKFNETCQPPWGEERLAYKVGEAMEAVHVKSRGHLLRGQPSAGAELRDPRAGFSKSAIHAIGQIKIRLYDFTTPISPPSITSSTILPSLRDQNSFRRMRMEGMASMAKGLAIKKYGEFRALDIETYPLEIKRGKNGKPLKTKDALNCHKGKIRLVSTCDLQGRAEINDLFERDFPSLGEHWLAHNAAFELRYIGTHFGIFPSKIFCTMTASKILLPGNLYSHKLGDVLERELGVVIPKELGSSGWGAKYLSEEQLEYARNDVRYLHQLMETLAGKIRAAGLEKIFEMESSLILVTAGMEVHGYAVDTGIMSTLKEVAEYDSEKYCRETRFLFGDDQLNLNSPAQLVKAFGLAGIKVKNVDEETLKKMNDDERAKLLLEYRRLKKLSTIIESLLKATHNGRIHSTFQPLGAQTGRFSSRDPNLQNIPKGPLRSCFIPSTPDRRLIVADYSQIELRVVALVAQDEVMIQAFKDGEDLHSKIVASIYGKPQETVSKKERFKGKAINFGFIYGQGAKGFVRYAQTNYDLILSLEDATRFREAFFELYPGVREWHSNCWTVAEDPENNSAHTIFGRLLVPDGDRAWNRFVMLTNYVVQGSCADLIKMAMIKAHKVIASDVHLIATVHDELIFDVPASSAEQHCSLIESAMIEAFVEMFGDRVPVKVEAKVCNNWGEKE